MMQQGMNPQIAAAIMQPQDMMPIQPANQTAVALGTLVDTPPNGLVAINHHSDSDLDLVSDDGTCHTPWEPWLAAVQATDADAEGSGASHDQCEIPSDDIREGVLQEPGTDAADPSPDRRPANPDLRGHRMGGLRASDCRRQ